MLSDPASVERDARAQAALYTPCPEDQQTERGENHGRRFRYRSSHMNLSIGFVVVRGGIHNRVAEPAQVHL